MKTKLTKEQKAALKHRQALAKQAKALKSVQPLIDRGALFVVNHSGGKDSQAMFDYVLNLVPREQIVVVHANLPEVDWEGVEDHIRATTRGLPIYTCVANDEDGNVNTFFKMVEKSGMFPSPEIRRCTSDLKRGPIERTIRAIVAETGNKLIVNCVGIRALESDARQLATPFKFDAKNSKAGREWYSWLPIFAWMEPEVFARIAAAGQQPHWAYAAGMSRLSCCFCIMSNHADLVTAAKLKPALYARYVALEKRLGFTLQMSEQGLEEITGIVVPGDVKQPRPRVVPINFYTREKELAA